MANTKVKGGSAIMADDKLLRNTEKQIEMVDELIKELIQEFQNYVKPGSEPLTISPDLNDALVAVNIKERLLQAREGLRFSADKDNLDFADIKPEITT
jgi:predicted DNA-binding protein (UPF0278 family)